MAQKRVNDLGRDPIGPLLLRLALPTVTAQLVNALYNIVDRMYIGHIAGEGDLALTGLGVCFPVIMFVSAVSALVGMGGASRAVVRMGEGKKELAESILGSCTLLLVLLAVAVTAVFLAVQEPMLYLFGATDETIGYAMDYLTIYLCGTLFVELSLGLNYFITSQGFSTTAMATVIIGAVINIVLHPIFIFGLHMGVRGAALATVVSTVVILVITTWRIEKEIRFQNLRAMLGAPLAGGAGIFLWCMACKLLTGNLWLRTGLAVAGSGLIYLAALALMKHEFYIEQIRPVLGKIMARAGWDR